MLRGPRGYRLVVLLSVEWVRWRIRVAVATLTGSACHLGLHRMGGASPAESLTGAAIDAVLDGPQVVERECAQIAALGEVLAEEPVGVLVRAAQPGAGWRGEEDAVGEVLLEQVVVRHLRALVPGQGLPG